MFDWNESAFFGFANEIENARMIAKELAKLEDPNNIEKQEEICNKYGIPLQSMSSSLAKFIEEEARKNIGY